MAGSRGEEGGVMMEREGVRGGSGCRERQQVRGKVAYKFREKCGLRVNTREKEERWRAEEQNRTIFLRTPPKCSHRERDSGGNRSDGGKKNRKRGVISALKIVSLPSFLSPGNSLHRKSVRTWFRPTPYINDLPTALTRSFFNVPFALPCT